MRCAHAFSSTEVHQRVLLPGQPVRCRHASAQLSSFAKTCKICWVAGFRSHGVALALQARLLAVHTCLCLLSFVTRSAPCRQAVISCECMPLHCVTSLCVHRGYTYVTTDVLYSCMLASCPQNSDPSAGLRPLALLRALHVGTCHACAHGGDLIQSSYIDVDQPIQISGLILAS